MKTTAKSHCAAVPACCTTAHRSLPARLKQLTLTAAAALALALAQAASAAAPPLVDTGISGNPTAINQSGQFVGTGETSPGSGVYQGFFVDPATGSVQFLPAFGTGDVYPTAINDSGLVLGTYFPGSFDVNGNSIFHAFVWSAAGGYRDIGPAAASSYPQAMNNAGQVAGVFYLPDGNERAFFWDGTTFTDLGTLGGNNSIARAVNIHGQVVGTTVLADGSVVGFIWDAANGMQQINAGYPEIITDAGIVGGIAFNYSGYGGGVHVWDAVNGATFYANPDTSQMAAFTSVMLRGVTPSRQAIVTFQNPFTGARSYVMDPVLGAQELLLPGGTRTSVRQVNKGGQAAGTFVTATGETHAFVWDAAHGMQDLGTLPGGGYSQALGISDSGQVTGEANTATGETHAFLWDVANGMQDLGTLGGTYSTGQLIGNGAVAGYANTTGDVASHVFYAKLSAGAPDLQVTTLTTTNNKAPQGHKVTVTAVVKNTGNAAAGASTTVIMDGTTVLATVATPALGAGDSVTLTLDLRTAAQNGTHVLSVAADTANAVAESDETNNTKTLTVNIKGNQVR